MSARPARALTVALLAALLGALLPAAAAAAAERSVRGGRLDWGLKSSFQSYVTGPVAKGSFRLKGGAATAGGSLFRFHSATGTYDPATGAFRAAFSGGVRFRGHERPDGTHELDLTVSRPVVRVQGGRGTLYADMASRAKGASAVTVTAGVPLAELSLSGIDMRGAGSPLVLDGVPAVLTAQGARAFAGYYPAGTRLDPVSLSVDVVAAPARPSARPSVTATPAAKPPTGGALSDGAVDWGVRRTFREYVSGPVGQGRWELTDGAQDGGAVFRFPSGKGTWEPNGGALRAEFAGTLRFTGAHLDLAFSKVTVTVAGGKGTLLADVTAKGATRRAVPVVEFEAAGLTAKDGLAVLTEAPARLAQGGALAFGSMYRAGTEMDPVSLAVALRPEARLPALPDLGSTASPGAAPPATRDPKAPAAASPAPAAAASEAGPGTGLRIAIGLGALLLAALTVLGIRFAKARRTPAG
ncbi:HtaA domain-containing protein [Streptomyces sp. NPDC097619]|uniref:HtaA domain-containing protein n=1 Tax=Streptomyces sp. NPDC097619 TaxID=3157228 RepID=UPI00331F9335